MKAAIPDPQQALGRMALIRAFETALSKRPDHGFQLLSSGEEAVAVGLCLALAASDQLLTGGRSIGPALARGLDPGRVMAELLGREAGLNGGRAGRGHMADPQSGFFGAHAVVGGNISIATGVALALQVSGKASAVAVMFGDGACGAGALAESLNIAAIWKLPIVFVCNNNGLSVSTRREAVLAPRQLSDFGKTFGLPSRTVDGMDVEAVFAATTEALDHVRSGAGPAFVECQSERFASHSTTARETRSRDELSRIRTRCPIGRYARALLERGIITQSQLEQMQSDAQRSVETAIQFAEASAPPSQHEVLAHVW